MRKNISVSIILFAAITLCSSFYSLLQPEKTVSHGFVIPVEDVFSISGMGIMIKGRIESGSLTPGMPIEARGKTEQVISLTAGKIFINNKEVTIAGQDDDVTFQVKGMNSSDVKMGMMICSPGVLRTMNAAGAGIYFLKKEEGGLTSPLKDNVSVQVVLHGRTEYATLIVNSAGNMNAGTYKDVSVNFENPVAAALLDSLYIKFNGKIIGSGKLIRVPAKAKQDQ